jgi:hypothetical protein
MPDPAREIRLSGLQPSSGKISRLSRGRGFIIALGLKVLPLLDRVLMWFVEGPGLYLRREFRYRDAARSHSQMVGKCPLYCEFGAMARAAEQARAATSRLNVNSKCS